MKDLIKEDIKHFIEEEVGMLSDHEINFNNADPSTRMKCYTDQEIRELIIKTMHEVKE